MKKALKKQTVIGIAGLLGTVLITVATFTLLHESLNLWSRAALLVVISGLFVGFLLCIFSGIKGFLSGLLYGSGAIGFVAASRILPHWLFGLLVLVLIIIFFCRPLIKEYKKDRQKSSKVVANPKLDEEIHQEEAAAQELDEEINEFNQSIRLGERSLLLLTKFNGFYQMIRGQDRFYLVYTGSELGGIDAELLKTDFSDESSLIGRKKDYSIEFKKITSVCHNNRKAVGTQLENCGNIILQTAEKRHAFTVLTSLTSRQIKAFFNGLPFTTKEKVKTKTVSHTRMLSDEDKLLLPKLKKICLVLSILAVLISAIFFFMPMSITTYKLVSTICMLIPAVTFGLYIRYNNLLSLNDKDFGGSNTAAFKKTSVQVITPLFFPPLILLLRTIMDFTITDFLTLLIWSVALIAAVLFVFLRFTKEYKHAKSALAAIIFVYVVYIPSSLVQINCLYDYTTPVIYTSDLIEKRISESKNHITYYYTVKNEEGREMDVSVTEEYYEFHEAGDAVQIVDNLGLLGIDYMYIDESDMEN